ncbi:MAG TPA: hypothetical protein ENI39_03000 [Anaerolineae bacterium]|nr:hypothetical protein [Anaerolineae bacterium]
MMVTLWLLAGLAVGVLNGLTLWSSVARLRPDVSGRAVAWILAGALLRLSLAASLLIVALQRGVLPGLLACAGLWLARWGLVCWLGFGQAVPPA